MERWSLRAGDTVRGTAVLHLPPGGRVDRWRVEVTGREVLGATPHYVPAVYQEPLPRPWGRLRSGYPRVLYQVVRELPTDETATSVDGKRLCPFDLALPTDALPTYGGLGAFCEHDVLLTAEVDGERFTAWRALHLWAAAAPPPLVEPLELFAPGPPHGWGERLSRSWRPPLRLAVTAPAARLALGEPLRLNWSVDNPAGLRTKHLLLHLVGIETSRNWAATDIHEFVVASRQIVLRGGGNEAGQVDWVLPERLAPDLRGPRFQLAWVLRAEVTLPWRLGISGQAPLRLWDPAVDAPRKDRAEQGESTAQVQEPRET